MAGAGLGDSLGVDEEKGFVIVSDEGEGWAVLVLVVLEICTHVSSHESQLLALVLECLVLGLVFVSMGGGRCRGAAAGKLVTGTTSRGITACGLATLRGLRGGIAGAIDEGHGMFGGSGSAKGLLDCSLAGLR
jgi:hypothetical protein